MANITPQGFIERNEELKAIADNNYFLDDNNVNVQYINNHLLRHQASFVQEALKQGSGLGTSVTKAYSKYVGQPVGDIQYPMTQLTSDYISQGSGVVTLEKTKEGNNEVWKPTYIPNEKYLLVDGVHTVYRFYVKEKLNAGPIGGGLKEKYLLVQTFLAGENTNTLYLINDIWLSDPMSIISNSSTKEVELDAITETEDLLPSVQTGIDVPVLWVTQDDPLAQVPISVISQCKELIYAIDRRQVMIDAQLLKNTEQFILMKNIQIPTDLNKLYNTGKGLDFNDLGRVLFTKNDQGSIEFVENTNSMLKDAMEAEEKTIRRISAISLVPVDYLGIESAQGNIGAGSRTLLHGAFIKAVEDIRELFGETFKEINEIIAAQNPDIDPTFTWEDVFAKSDDEVVAELKVAVESGLLPLKRAIMEYQGITEEEAQLQVDERMEAAMAIQETTVEETTEEEETV